MFSLLLGLSTDPGHVEICPAWDHHWQQGTLVPRLLLVPNVMIVFHRGLCALCCNRITHVSDSLLVFGGEDKMLAKRQVQCINGKTLGKPARHDMCHLPARWLSSPSFWTRWHSISNP